MLAIASWSFGARLALITALGAAWRLAYLFAARIDDPLLLNDSLYYSIQAGLNSEGRWFEEALTGQPGAEHGPLTSLYLTPWSLGAGDGVPAQRLAMTLVGIATVAVVGLLGRRAVGTGGAGESAGADRRGAERCGLVAAAIAAAYPNLWLNDSVVMSEALAVLLVALALLAALAHHDHPSVRSGLLVGFVCGLAALARSELLLLAVGFAALSLIVCRRRRTPLWPGLAVVLAAGLTVAPWALYNLGRFDHAVLLSTNDGNTLLGANCATTYYDDVGHWDLRCLGPLDEPSLGDFADPPDASERSRQRREQAVEYVADHLDRVPVVVAARLGRLVDVYGLGSMVRMDVGEDKAEWAVWAGIVAWWVLALAALAGWRAAARRRLASRWWLLVPILAVVITAVLFYGAHRIRAPAEPAVVVLAALTTVRYRRAP